MWIRQYAVMTLRLSPTMRKHVLAQYSSQRTLYAWYGTYGGFSMSCRGRSWDSVRDLIPRLGAAWCSELPAPTSAACCLGSQALLETNSSTLLAVVVVPQ